MRSRKSSNFSCTVKMSASAWQGMKAVAQGVDNGHARPVRQILNGPMREGARHDRVGPAVEVAGDVLQRLALADWTGAQDCVAAQLA